jgi:NAD(P)-dependent dehydrogenase (short-subunit alcohol dehydrogenase family)
MNYVVTGASSGIGRATAVLLADQGHRVFAGVRKDADAEAIVALGKPNLVPWRVDVGNTASIASAVAEVAAALGDEPLHGLVNNAGIGRGGPIEYLALDDWREQFEVNLFGPIALIQGFADLLRRGPGRIVNVTSIGGRVASPFMGPYCASKFALEAVTDSLRAELAPWGIELTAIEPGSVATPIWDKAKDETKHQREKLGPAANERYGAVLDKVSAGFEAMAKRGIPPERVAEVIVGALMARRAPTRVLVGIDAKVGGTLKNWLPDRWFDAFLART